MECYERVAAADVCSDDVSKSLHTQTAIRDVFRNSRAAGRMATDAMSGGNDDQREGGGRDKKCRPKAGPKGSTLA